MADANPKAMTGALSDANSKPVAGASEPRELEERVRKAVNVAVGICAGRDYDLRTTYETDLAIQLCIALNDAFRLSHTAKETSNG